MKKYLLVTTFLFVVLIIAACTTVAVEEETVLESEQEVQTEPTATEIAEIVATDVPAAPNPTDLPAPTSTKPAEEPTEESTLAPTVVGGTEESSAGVPIPEQADSEVEIESENDPVVFGRTAEGAFFYGSPTAEITLIDYSEFL